MEDEQLSEKDVRYENMFLSILQNEEKIEPFLDSVFKFLFRRTDFFLHQESPQQSYGFPKGVAKDIVLRTFDKYDRLSKMRVKEKIVEAQVKSQKTHEAAVVDKIAEGKSESKPKIEEQSTVNAVATEGSVNSDLKKKQEHFQNCPESYNGAIRDKYSWSQSIKDIDVKVKVGSKIIKSKDVKVKIEKQLLQVQAKNDSSSFDVLIDDKLSWKIKPEESTWSLFPGDHIHINLEKTDERWWENLLENEEKLDLKNMNPEKPMHDLEPEAQVKIQQLMYDQHRKQLGLPSSEEEKYQEMLKKAWNAEGSPFAGTEFDPSRISLQDGKIQIN